MASFLRQLPTHMWWVILSKLPIEEIYKDNILKSEFGSIVKSSKFRFWLMQLHKPTNEVYDIDIDNSFLQPQNTMTLRQCEFDHAGRENNCIFNNCPSNGDNAVQMVWYGNGGQKLEHKEWFDLVTQQRLGYGLNERDMNDMKQFEMFFDELKAVPLDTSKHSRLLTPIEMQNVQAKTHPFEHSWNLRDISRTDHLFDVSSETQKLAQNHVFDKYGSCVNFPKSEKILTINDADFHERLDSLWNERQTLHCGSRGDYKLSNPLRAEELFDKSKLYLDVR